MQRPKNKSEFSSSFNLRWNCNIQLNRSFLCWESNWNWVPGWRGRCTWVGRSRSLGGDERGCGFHAPSRRLGDRRRRVCWCCSGHLTDTGNMDRMAVEPFEVLRRWRWIGENRRVRRWRRWPEKDWTWTCDDDDGGWELLTPQVRSCCKKRIRNPFSLCKCR